MLSPFVKQLSEEEHKLTKTEQSSTVGNESAKESEGETTANRKLEQFGESNKGYLTEHELLADFAPPFARGAPCRNKESNGQTIVFQFSTQERNHQKRKGFQATNSLPATASPAGDEGETKGKTC